MENSYDSDDKMTDCRLDIEVYIGRYSCWVPEVWVLFVYRWFACFFRERLSGV